MAVLSCTISRPRPLLLRLARARSRPLPSSPVCGAEAAPPPVHPAQVELSVPAGSLRCLAVRRPCVSPPPAAVRLSCCPAVTGPCLSSHHCCRSLPPPCCSSTAGHCPLSSCYSWSLSLSWCTTCTHLHKLAPLTQHLHTPCHPCSIHCACVLPYFYPVHHSCTLHYRCYVFRPRTLRLH